MEHERYFGLHFDFHAGNDVEIGANTNSEDIEWFINEARPDFIQCDCKGHPGNSCYPTRVGKAADKLKADNLKVWVDTAKKNNLPIYVHYSGIWDKAYLEKHPEDAALYYNDDWNIEATSLFGGYVDRLLIPQLKELIEDYGIDGAWIDGDCWAVKRDSSENAKPYLWENITDEEHDKVMRDAFFRYVKKYVDELHTFRPGFKITSNWMYSSYIPEKPEVAIDFISGDYHSSDSVYSARYEGRCMTVQGLPWDLMTWGFTGDRGYEEKCASQLMQEAALAISLGGGFQVYLNQNRDGSAKRLKTDRFKKLGDFMRERRMCYRKEHTAQVGIHYSAESRYKKSNIFNQSGSTKALIGALNCILDAQYTAGIILDYQLGTLDKYEIVVIPEWEYISDDKKEKFLEYAKNGGSLVVMGAQACMQFGGLTNHKVTPLAAGKERYIMSRGGEFIKITGDICELESGCEPMYSTNDIRYTSSPAYSVTELGKGRLVLIPFNLGSIYKDRKSYIMSDFMKKLLRTLSTPLVEVNKTHIDISLLKDGGKTLLNLVNMCQSRHDLSYMVYEQIPPLENVEVIINKPCKRVTMPLGEEFEASCEANRTVVKLKKLDIHSIITIE